MSTEGLEVNHPSFQSTRGLRLDSFQRCVIVETVADLRVAGELIRQLRASNLQFLLFAPMVSSSCSRHTYRGTETRWEDTDTTQMDRRV